MTGLRPGGFARSLRGLDRDELAAFVAELWGAGGWATSVEGPLVVAEQSGRRRRIRVVDGGRGLGRLRRRAPILGAPSADDLRSGEAPADDPDVVVDASGSGRVAAAARAVGAEYVPPAALRDRLLYGVPRAEGAALSELFLDESLERLRRRSRADPPAGRHALLLGAVALLVVGTLAAGPLGVLPGGLGQPTGATDAQSGPGGSAPTTTVGAAPTATEAIPTTTGSGPSVGVSSPPTTESSYPPGLSPAGVENVSALADAHVAATTDRRYAVDVHFDGPAAATGFEDFESVRWSLVAERLYHFRVDATYRRGNDSDQRRVSRGVYADAITLFERTATPNGTSYEAIPARAHDPETHRSVPTTMIGRYLDTTESVVRPAGTTEGPRYHVVSMGAPTRLNDAVTDYRAEALVTPEGRVTMLEARYTIEVDGAERSVQVGFDYRDFGTAIVTPPDWHDESRNVTGT